jgi:hypothetical protein
MTNAPSGFIHEVLALVTVADDSQQLAFLIRDVQRRVGPREIVAAAFA